MSVIYVVTEPTWDGPTGQPIRAFTRRADAEAWLAPIPEKGWHIEEIKLDDMSEEEDESLDPCSQSAPRA